MKKALALMLTLVFALALCSCSGSDSSSEGESSITSTGILGKWDLDSYESDTSRTPGVDFKASMEVFDDETFTMTQAQIAQGDEMSVVMTGTYKKSDKENVYDFVFTHATLSFRSQTSEQDENGKFTATVDGDKLTLDKPDSSPSIIYMNRVG